MELALERVISMVTGAVAAAGQQRKHDLEDTMHLRVEGQASRGVMDENHDETVPEKHTSQPQITRTHASKGMSHAQSFHMYLQLAVRTHKCVSGFILGLTHPARCRHPRHRGFEVIQA